MQPRSARALHTPLVVCAFLAVACSEAPVAPQAGDDPSIPLRASGAGHQVSVGGADVCTAFGLSPGCDANYSLNAREMPDGSDQGEWHDTINFPPVVGVHVAIDCLNVVGNEAWVSGVVTNPPSAAGTRVITKMADNGTSSNDPPDQISFTWDAFPDEDCDDPGFIPLFDLSEGQVTVR